MTVKLTRQNHNMPDFNELQETKKCLMAFLERSDINTDTWNDGIEAIVRFQDERGGFSLLDSYKIESDVRVDFCYMPTYICTAILMKAFVLNADIMTKKADVLEEALKACCGRNLAGHGYDSFKGVIDALEVFMKGGLREFLLYYPDLCPDFTKMIKRTERLFSDKEAKREFSGAWGEDYAESIRRIVDYFKTFTVFVYGTLRKGQRNHEYFLSNSECLGNATVEGFKMYDIGAFPGIVPETGIVHGELYKVTKGTLSNLDYLEGEGNLFIRRCKCAQTESGDIYLVQLYEYNHAVEGLERINVQR